MILSEMKCSSAFSSVVRAVVLLVLALRSGDSITNHCIVLLYHGSRMLIIRVLDYVV